MSSPLCVHQCFNSWIVFWVGKIVEEGTKSYKFLMSTWCNSSCNSKHKYKIDCKIVEKGTKSYTFVMSTWCNSSCNSKHKCKIGCKIVEKGTKSYKFVMLTWCNSSCNSKHTCKIGCLNYKLQPLYCYQNTKLSIICQKNWVIITCMKKVWEEEEEVKRLDSRFWTFHNSA